MSDYPHYPLAIAIELNRAATGIKAKRIFDMTGIKAKRAPFSWIYTEKYMLNYGKLDRRREWIEDGFTRLIIDRHGNAAQFIRAGIDADKLVDEFNTAAAMIIMTEGTPAVNFLKTGDI